MSEFGCEECARTLFGTFHNLAIRLSKQANVFHPTSKQANAIMNSTLRKLAVTATELLIGLFSVSIWIFL